MHKTPDLVWLHLSDIHFLPKTSWRDVAARRSLLTFLKGQFEQGLLPRPDLVFCTGDIAFGEAAKAPMPQQYAHAKEFFDDLLKCCKLPIDRLFVVPGNHDVNRNEINPDAQDALRRKAEEPRQYEPEINQRFSDNELVHQHALKRLGTYGEFISRHLPHQADADRHVYARVLDIRGRRIGVAGFNSAWSCAGPEDDRHLWLAAQWQFNHVQPQLESACMRIGLIHHPIDCLNESERDLCTRRISSEFDFWLHGHSHNAWVDPGQHGIKIAAGATGADHPEEFGFNLVSLDFATKRGAAHLFGYSPRDNGWIIQAVPHHAPAGVWDLVLPSPVETASLPEAEHIPIFPAEAVSAAPTESTPIRPASLPVSTAPKLYGRQAMLDRLGKQLQQKNVLLLYGMRGNGKTELIRHLSQQGPLAGRELRRIPASSDYGPDYLFRQLASLLRDNAEQPQPPDGDIDAMAAKLRERYPDTQPACIWIDMAHQWFDANGWRKPELGKLFVACRRAFADRWHWIFELRERPTPGILGRDSLEEQVPGLDKANLGECLRDAAPAGQEEHWNYTGDKLKQLYQWLGGGHKDQAHPQAIQLLIEVARGLRIAPLEVLQRHAVAAEDKVANFLLRELYESVLSVPEQTLLQALALYRDAIPHDHADLLEQKLNVEHAWIGLDRRCLLPSDADQAHFYLHGFIAGWLRHRLGYLASDDDREDASLAGDISAAQRNKLVQLHTDIAECWLAQLGGSRRLTQPNIRRALEALHHLLAAGEGQRIHEISASLLGTHAHWASARLWTYDEQLRQKCAPIADQRQVLDFITQLDPSDHKAWRFLGECWQKEEGRVSPKALDAFEKALDLYPGFPQYLANVGQALLAQGRQGAQTFLQRLAEHRQDHPEAVDEFVIAIEADCLQMIDDGPVASALRQARIEAGDRNPAFYAAEAEYHLNHGKADEAMRFLDLAQQRGCANAYIESIRAKVLEAKGDGPAASVLRQARIEAGDRDRVFYSAEAEFQLNHGEADEAMRFLDLAQQRGCVDAYTESIRAKVLEAKGDGQAASALRQARIEADDRDPIFYSAEAEFQLNHGQADEAMRFLDLAQQRGCADDYTQSIRAKVLERMGR